MRESDRWVSVRLQIWPVPHILSVIPICSFPLLITLCMHICAENTVYFKNLIITSSQLFVKNGNDIWKSKSNYTLLIIWRCKYKTLSDTHPVRLQSTAGCLLFIEKVMNNAEGVLYKWLSQVFMKCFTISSSGNIIRNDKVPLYE